MSAIVPYYYAFDDQAIVAHFRALLKVARDTPLLAYEFPDRTGNRLSAEAFGTLVGDGLAGLKDSTGSVEVHEAFLAAAPGAQIFVGSPSLMLGSLRGGSRGCVAALANLHPALIVALGDAWRAGDDARGRAPAGRDRRDRGEGPCRPAAGRAQDRRRRGDGRARRALPLGAAQPARRLTPPHRWTATPTANSPRPIPIHSGSR